MFLLLTRIISSGHDLCKSFFAKAVISCMSAELSDVSLTELTKMLILVKTLGTFKIFLKQHSEK